jgi:hypothetical protein
LHLITQSPSATLATRPIRAATHQNSMSEPGKVRWVIDPRELPNDRQPGFLHRVERCVAAAGQLQGVSVQSTLRTLHEFCEGPLIPVSATHNQQLVVNLVGTARFAR